MAKKGRKRIPKRFASDFINTYKGLDQNMIRAYAIFNNRSRVQTMSGSLPIHKEGIDGKPITGNTFTQPIPETRSQQRYRGPETPYQHEYKVNGDFRHIQIKNKYEEGREPEAIEEHSKQVWLPTPRAEALSKATLERHSKSLYRVLQSDRQQKVVEFSKITIRKLPGLIVYLHFEGFDYVFEQISEKHRAVSRTYRGREEAMLAFNTFTISWSILEDV